MKPEKIPNSKCRKFKFRIAVSRVFKISIFAADNATYPNR